MKNLIPFKSFFRMKFRLSARTSALCLILMLMVMFVLFLSPKLHSHATAHTDEVNVQGQTE